ncbi:MAG: hypothetical protein DHS20C07_19360 [Methyloligella sp.]|nr:MAG: hypothetical protein DHS20C07_19360 [Methyloligella sp.]
MINFALGVLGLGRRNPLVAGLIIFAVLGLTYNFFENRIIANDAVREAQVEAIKEDAKENRKIVEETQEDLEKLNNEISQVNKTEAKEIDKIEKLTPHQCLDLKLSDLGL